MAVTKKKKKKVESPPWLTSWGDLTTLLLVFFVIMMSFADIEGKDFFLILSSFRGSLGMFQGGYSLSAGRLEELGQNMQNLPSTVQGRALAKSLKKAISIFKPEIEAKKVRVTEDERGLVITLPGDVFFESGSARLKEDTRPVLEKVGNILKTVPNFARIEGHTDTRPTGAKGADEGYSTNWELSSARAVNVLRYLTEEENVEPKQLSAVAFGETRPLDVNTTPEGRAYNRRVDIVILKEKAYFPNPIEGVEGPLPDEEWR